MNLKKGFKRILFCLNVLLALFGAFYAIKTINMEYKSAQDSLLKSENYDVLFTLNCFNKNGISYVPVRLTAKDISMAKKELDDRAKEIASRPDLDMIDVINTINTLEEFENNYFAKMSYKGMIAICALGGLLGAIITFVVFWIIFGLVFIVIGWISRGFTDIPAKD